jgi:predicted small lipoprotein YifL
MIRMQRRRGTSVASALAIAVLMVMFGGCGQKGPLVLSAPAKAASSASAASR